MAKRFKVKDILSYKVTVKGLSKQDCTTLAFLASEMGGAVVIRPEVAKVAKHEQ